jgi:flavin-dependent dehydrogenase
MDYDVIIAGGSFGGLAAAAQLRGKYVLLIEPHAIGSVQTSACGTLLAVLEATAALDSLLQTHDRIVLHLGHTNLEYSLPYSFCTFDYQTFCHSLLDQAQVEVLHASVLGHRGHIVYTSRGAFDAEILIDATGWRAALAKNTRWRAKPHAGKSFGLETSIPVSEEGLHFYYDPRRLRPFNVGWLFPTGSHSRAGLASYRGNTQVGGGLRDFVRDRFECPPDGRHGGYFPYRRRPATTGNVFRVGDAAGQCIPLTGEGIRPALYFGAQAGRLARRVLEGQMRLPEALGAYRQFVDSHKGIYRFTLLGQKIVPGLPIQWIERLAKLIHHPGCLDPVLRAYWNAMDPLKISNFTNDYQPIGRL